MATETTAVYELWNHHGDLIYIGETYSDRVERRWNEHITNQPWGAEISLISSRIHGIYPNKKTARQVEKHLIQSHQPRYNKVHNRSWRVSHGTFRGHRKASVGMKIFKGLGRFLLAVLQLLFYFLCQALEPGRGKRSSLPYKLAKWSKKKLKRKRRR